MKKLFVFLLMLAGYFSFAESDVGVNFGLLMNHSNYEIDSKQFLKDSKCTFIGLQNYNFLDSENHFGFFEKVSFGIDAILKIDFLTGPAFGFDIYRDLLRIETGAGFHLLYSFDENNEEAYPEKNIDLSDFSLGVGADFKMKFFPHQAISPVLGLEAGWDPYCRGVTFIDKKSYYINYTSYYLVYIRPFAGLLCNF